MKYKIDIVCETTNRPCVLEYNIVIIPLAGGEETRKVGTWHCSERQENNINETCTCNKTISKINIK